MKVNRLLLLLIIISVCINKAYTQKSMYSELSLTYLQPIFNYPVAIDYQRYYVYLVGGEEIRRVVNSNFGNGLKFNAKFRREKAPNFSYSFLWHIGEKIKYEYQRLTLTTGFDEPIHQERTLQARGVGVMIGHTIDRKLKNKFHYRFNVDYGLYFPRIIYKKQDLLVIANEVERVKLKSKYFATLSWNLSAQLTYDLSPKTKLLLGLEYFDVLIPEQFITDRVEFFTRTIGDYFSPLEDRKIISYTTYGIRLGIEVMMGKKGTKTINKK